MTDEQKTTELYRLAYQCAEYKQQGCTGYCGNCQFNVNLYVKDPRESVLIQTSAALDQAKSIQYDNSERTFNTACLIIVLGFIGFIVYCCAPTKPKDVADIRPAQNLYEAYYVMEHLIQDINDDGEITCIDYAVIFNSICRTARIIRNKNPRTGMDHLFNQVNFDGVPMYVEPQGSIYCYRMEDFWGERYDPRYNRDETNKWRLR
jgi:hypothetical protein